VIAMSKKFATIYRTRPNGFGRAGSHSHSRQDDCRPPVPDRTGTVAKSSAGREERKEKYKDKQRNISIRD
jgi:hypothetical protein